MKSPAVSKTARPTDLNSYKAEESNKQTTGK
jgi:hypothetical protein